MSGSKDKRGQRPGQSGIRRAPSGERSGSGKSGERQASPKPGKWQGSKKQGPRPSAEKREWPRSDKPAPRHGAEKPRTGQASDKPAPRKGSDKPREWQRSEKPAPRHGAEKPRTWQASDKPAPRKGSDKPREWQRSEKPAPRPRADKPREWTASKRPDRGYGSETPVRRPGTDAPRERQSAQKPHPRQGAYEAAAEPQSVGIAAESPARHQKEPRRKPSVVAGRTGPFWLYGLHAARAALANPLRKVRRAVLSPRAAAELGPQLLKSVQVETADPDAVGKLLPAGSVHQVVALFCDPLPERDLQDVLLPLAPGHRVVAILDQVTDPHNEGAILRSAAAFGVAAVIVQERHGPPETGALAKAASGALDIVPRIVVVNIARALEELGRLGFWRIALAADGEASLGEAATSGDIAIVLGAEGTGLRRLVRERCDIGGFIPMAGAMESLNVSNAAAIAFYQLKQADKAP